MLDDVCKHSDYDVSSVTMYPCSHWLLGSYIVTYIHTQVPTMYKAVCVSMQCHRLLENYEEDIERWWFKL